MTLLSNLTVGFDSGYIAGVIVMKPWLDVFGTFGQLPGNDPSAVGVYLPTADKSLVVSILSAGTLCVDRPLERRGFFILISFWPLE